jgi:surface polysaccharide O-acyltransferase-like enzyme
MTWWQWQESNTIDIKTDSEGQIMIFFLSTLAFVVLVGLVSLRHKFFKAFKSLCIAAFIAAIFTAGVYFTTERVLYTREISVTALNEANPVAEGTEIYIRGVIADGRWSDAKDVFDTGWLSDDGKLYWRSYDVPDGYPDTIKGKVLYKNDLSVVFDSNKWRGKAAVRLSTGETQTVDCFNASDSDQETAFTIESVKQDHSRTLRILSSVGFALLFAVLLLLLYREETVLPVRETLTASRIVYIDLLKIVGAAAIVYLHLMSPYQFMDNPQQWKLGLLFNSATRFAVPVFLMISGALLLSKQNDSMTLLPKRLLRLSVPLLFWSICYILIGNRNNAGFDFIKELLTIPFNHKQGHLWYVYNLIELYLLAPVLIPLYNALSNKRRLWFVAVGLLIPGFFDMLKNLIGLSVPNMIALTWTHIGIPEIALVFLGKLLYDHHGELTKKVKLSACGGGYALIVLGNGYLSLKNHAPAEAFFVHTSLPSVLFGVGVFLTFSIFENRLNALGTKSRSVIAGFSALTMGTYLMQMFVITVLGMVRPATWEELKSCQYVFLIGAEVFLICLALTFVLSKIPWVRKLIG